MDDTLAISASTGSLSAPDAGGYTSIIADNNSSTGATSTVSSSTDVSAATIGFSADTSGKTKPAYKAAAASTSKQSS
jgi:hypothetical protein